MKKFLMIGLMASVLTGCSTTAETKIGADGIVHGTINDGVIQKIASMKDLSGNGFTYIDQARKYCLEVRSEKADCEADAEVPILAEVKIAALSYGYINAVIPTGKDFHVNDMVQFERYRMGFGVTSTMIGIIPENAGCKRTMGVTGNMLECSDEYRKGWHYSMGMYAKHPE